MAINYIIESYVIGQIKQMVEQIDEVGIYDFVTSLENYDIDTEVKLKILITYLRIKNR